MKPLVICSDTSGRGIRYALAVTGAAGRHTKMIRTDEPAVAELEAVILAFEVARFAHLSSVVIEFRTDSEVVDLAVGGHAFQHSDIARAARRLRKALAAERYWSVIRVDRQKVHAAHLLARQTLRGQHPIGRAA